MFLHQKTPCDRGNVTINLVRDYEYVIYLVVESYETTNQTKIYAVFFYITKWPVFIIKTYAHIVLI